MRWSPRSGQYFCELGLAQGSDVCMRLGVANKLTLYLVREAGRVGPKSGLVPVRSLRTRVSTTFLKTVLLTLTEFASPRPCPTDARTSFGEY